jgi:hypothetical protein
MTSINKTLTPLVTLNIDKANGTKIEKSFSVIQTIFLLQKIRVTLKLEKLFRRKFKTYEIHFEDEDLNLTADITKTTESWRPKTGHLYLAPKKARNLIVVPVPQGKLACPTTMMTNK